MNSIINQSNMKFHEKYLTGWDMKNDDGMKFGRLGEPEISRKNPASLQNKQHSSGTDIWIRNRSWGSLLNCREHLERTLV